MTLSSGARLGPYEIVAPLGAGGMGEVYRARDGRLDRDVAVKVLPDRVAADPVSLARFEREAKAVAALSHPNIVAIHDVGREGSTSYAVMELLEGATLREHLAEGRSAREGGRVRAQDPQGLRAPHERGSFIGISIPKNVRDDRDNVKVLAVGSRAGLHARPTRTHRAPTSGVSSGDDQPRERVCHVARAVRAGARPSVRIVSFGVVLLRVLVGPARSGPVLCRDH